jgi:hypothetical protein
MGEWLSIEDWPECRRFERPGIVFELANRDGQSLFTPCVQPLPEIPFDWASPPGKFRAVAEPEPVHSAPLPEPKP